MTPHDLEPAPSDTVGGPGALDSAWVRRQVTTHLVFGFLARRFPFGWVLASGASLVYMYGSYNGWPKLHNVALFIPVGLGMLTKSTYRQAALGWCFTKATLGSVVFLFLIAGAPVAFFHGDRDALPLTLLALIWLPGLEFIPRLVEHQRVLTLTRAALSMPLVYSLIV